MKTMIIHPASNDRPLLAILMVSFISGFSDAALLFGLVQAAAIKQQGISPLRPSDILSYMPFACYAAAVLCVSLYIHLGPSKKTVM
jgi:ABC-type uncharacterized transport system permease subunit